MISFDTNLIIRLMIEDDAAQARRARTTFTFDRALSNDTRFTVVRP